MIQFKPTGSKILVEPLTQQQVYVGKLSIPQAHRDAEMEGIVAAVGPGKINRKGRLEAPEVKMGDRVLFVRHSGNEVQIGRRKFRLMEPSDLLAIVE